MVFLIFIVLQNGNFIYFTEALPFINSIDSKLKKRRTKDGLVQIKFSFKKKTAATSRNEAVVAIWEGKLLLRDQ